MSMNLVILLGNVGRDPETRSMNSGDKVASFSLATSRPYKDKATGERKEQVEWHNIVCFNQNLIPIIEQYVKKGSKVGVQGTMKTRKWEKEGQTHYSTEVVLERFGGTLTLEGPAPGAGGHAREEGEYGSTRTRDSGSNGSSGQSFAPRGNTSNDLDDDIPF